MTTNQTNVFEEDDEKGRLHLTKCDQDKILIFFSKQIATKHDGFLYSGITHIDQRNEKDFQRFIFDIKKRHTSYPSMMIEKDKYDYLFEMCDTHKEKKLKPLYINVIDNTVYAWILTYHLDLNWQYELLPRKTSEQIGFQRKLVSYLPLNRSFIIK